MVCSATRIPIINLLMRAFQFSGIEGGNKEISLLLGEKEAKRIKHEVNFKYRGIYKIGEVEYEIGEQGQEIEQGVQNILVVDDDVNLANTFKLILQSVGFHVDIAATGLQALYKTNRTDFDLIILDVNLPDMLGDEVAEKIKDKKSDTNIIMITGYSSFKDGIEEKGLDINEILMKPIPPEDLVNITKKTLKKEH